MTLRITHPVGTPETQLQVGEVGMDKALEREQIPRITPMDTICCKEFLGAVRPFCLGDG